MSEMRKPIGLDAPNPRSATKTPKVLPNRIFSNLWNLICNYCIIHKSFCFEIRKLPGNSDLYNFNTKCFLFGLNCTDIVGNVE